MLRRRLSWLGLALCLGALVVVFIAVPVGAVLVRSFAVESRLPPAEMKALTERALDLLEPVVRRELLDGWTRRATPKQRMEAIAAAFEIHDLEVPWERTAAFDQQIAAAEAALAGLSPALREAVEADLPIAIAMLHHRVPLAFKVRDQLSAEEFDRLREGKQSSFGLAHYLRIVTESRFATAALNSLTLATTVTLLATGLAFFLSYGVNRRAVAFPELARYGLLLPLVSPPVVLATAAILLFGRQGLVTYGLLDRTLDLIDADATNLYGFPGVVLAQTLSFIPPAFIILDNLLAKQDGRLEEAAASQGATAAQTFWQVTLPMAQPGLIRAATLIFILSMTDFGNPQVIGKNLPVLAGVLYDEMIGFHNTALSSAMAVWLIVPALCVYLLLGRVGRRKRFETDVHGGPPDFGLPKPARRALSGLTWSIIAFSVLIYGTILVGAFVRVWGQDFTLTLGHFTSAEVSAGFVSEVAGIKPVWTSVVIAVIAAPFGGLLAVAIAFLSERFRSRSAEVLSFLVLLPAILPGVIFGIGYIVAFNNPLGIKGLALTNTHAILVLNIIFGNLFVGVLAGRALLRRLDRSIDEAAESLGAGLMQRFALVTLPVMRRAVLLGGLYVFIEGMTSFSALVFLQGPGTKLASVAIFDLASATFYGAACAMSVAVLLIVCSVMLVLKRLEGSAPRMAVPKVEPVTS